MPNLIVEFLKEQNRALGLELYSAEDFAEAATFDERKFFKQLTLSDSSLNPWCTDYCSSCSYGERHDICGLVGSTYSEARGYDFAPYLYERPGMVRLCLKFKFKSWWRSLWNSN